MLWEQNWEDVEEPRRGASEKGDLTVKGWEETPF